jgi:hypothetical protein
MWFVGVAARHLTEDNTCTSTCTIRVLTTVLYSVPCTVRGGGGKILKTIFIANSSLTILSLDRLCIDIV